jgi:hypothetical protein
VHPIYIRCLDWGRNHGVGCASDQGARDLDLDLLFLLSFSSIFTFVDFEHFTHFCELLIVFPGFQGSLTYHRQ